MAPYEIKKLKSGKYAIIRKVDGKKVGESSSRAKAGASIGYRMAGENK